MSRGAILRIVESVVALLVLAAGGFAAFWFLAEEPLPEKAAEREAARGVVVDVVARRDQPVRVRAMGTVTPALQAVLRPQVGGRIVSQHKRFVPGGFFAAGTTMVQIDRADYEQVLLQRRTAVKQAKAALDIELGDQAVAKEELALLEADIPEVNRDLVLRIPQVNRARAEVEAAEAAVQQARLDLERTAIRAPFDGHVVDRAVTVGNNVGVGDEVATLVGADVYWVELALPPASLRWIDGARPVDRFDGDPPPGSRALVQNPRVWGDGVHREGHVRQVVGRLEQGSRLARVLVEVQDPLGREPGSRDDGAEDPPALLLGAFVDVEIIGRTLPDCVVVDRDLIRTGDTVWVMGAEDRLETRRVEIAWRGRHRAYVVDGLADGDRVIRTNLQTPVDGMLLRVTAADGESGGNGGTAGDVRGG